VSGLLETGLTGIWILTLVPVNAQDACSNADFLDVYSFVLSGTSGISPFGAASQTAAHVGVVNVEEDLNFLTGALRRRIGTL
jgi:hypothetical protein